MTIAITHDVTPALQNCQLTYIDRNPIDIERAREQHAQYRAALTRAGAKVHLLTENTDYPDACFVEDNAIVLDELAIITSMGTPSRRGEQAAIARALSDYRKLVYSPEGTTIEGGDILRIGTRLFAGNSGRSGHRGISHFSSLAEQAGYDFQVFPVHQCLHLKTACSAVDDETILINPNWIDEDVFSGLRVIHVPESEPFGANCLRVNDTLLVSSQAPRTAELAQKYHAKVEMVDISEFHKAEAGLTCLSIIFQG